MQSASNDNEWKLKKLQHDSLKAVERSVDALREGIEKEVLAVAQEYERLFGPRSAQFTEYLTMVAMKLEMHGIVQPEITSWLVSVASEGTVKKTTAMDRRDSQSQTVPLIDGGPMLDFGEQSLMDRSLGSLGVGSPRPGVPTNQAVTSPYPVWGEDTLTDTLKPVNPSGNGQSPPVAPSSAPPTNPHPAAQMQAPVSAPVQASPPPSPPAPAAPPQPPQPPPASPAPPPVSSPASAAPGAAPPGSNALRHLGPTPGASPITPIMQSWDSPYQYDPSKTWEAPPIVSDSERREQALQNSAMQKWEFPANNASPAPQAEAPQPIAPVTANWESSPISTSVQGWSPAAPVKLDMSEWDSPQPIAPIMPTAGSEYPPSPQPQVAPQPVGAATQASYPPPAPGNMPLPVRAPTQQNMPSFSQPGQQYPAAQPPMQAPLPPPIPPPQPPMPPRPATQQNMPAFPQPSAPPATVPMPVRAPTQYDLQSLPHPPQPPRPPAQPGMPQPNFNQARPATNQSQPTVSQPQPGFNQTVQNTNQSQSQPQPWGPPPGQQPHGQPAQTGQYGTAPLPRAEEKKEEEPTYDPSTAWG